MSDRKTFKIWDTDINDWYKPTFEAYKGKLEYLMLSPGGDLSMITIGGKVTHESMFPDRFEIVWE